MSSLLLKIDLPLIYSFVCHPLAMLSTTPELQSHCLRLLYVHVPKTLYLLQLLSQEFTHLGTKEQTTALCSFSVGQLFVLCHTFAHDCPRV